MARTAIVQIPDSAALRPTNLTIEAWVRFSSLDSAGSGGSPAGDQYIVFKQNTRRPNFEGFDLSKTRVAGGDVFRFLVTSATAQTAQIDSATLLTTGVWYHVAAVRGSNFTQLYVNGQLERQTNVAFAQNYGACRFTSAPPVRPTGTINSKGRWMRFPFTTARSPRTKSLPFTPPARLENAKR